jgi:hypothetical protein
MAKATEFTIGAKASCSDGFCGEVTRMITDPATRTVTHLVIDPKHRDEHQGRLVPLELVDTTAGGIRLRCTVAEFDALEPAEEVVVAEAGDYEGGYRPTDPVVSYGDSRSTGLEFSVSGMNVGSKLGHRIPTVVNDIIPAGETELRHGERIQALDGEIGQVQGFIVNPEDHKVTHVLLIEGHLWGRKEVAIPLSAVTRMDDEIQVNLTKKQVEQLPPVH